VTLSALAGLRLVWSAIADARRMGGGGNFGAQRSISPQKAAPAPAAPASSAASPSSPPTSQPAAPASASAPKAPPAATPGPAPSGMRWRGPIAGIAAGLGLAALMSHLGLSEGFGTILLLGLVMFGGIFMLRMFLGRRQMSAAPLQYSGAVASANSNAPSALTPSAPSWRIPGT